MKAPTPESIQISLSALKKGAPLVQTDFAHICWEFASQPGADDFLKLARAHNPKLADTLIIFRHKLAEAITAGASPEPVAQQAFLHYVINTDGLIPEPEDAGPFNVFDAVRSYAESLSVGVSELPDGASLLDVDDKKEPFPEWAPIPGWSAARMLRKLGPVINRVRYGRDAVIPSSPFGFDENATGHSLQNAIALADCSHLAYFGAPYVEKQLQDWGYGPFRWVEDKKTDTQAFVAGRGEHLVVCFRGTSSGKDALVDTSFLKTAAFGGRGKVHRGFNKALDRTWGQLQEAVEALGPDRKLFICGHSLGAALAQLAAHRFALGGYKVAAIYVFGSPRVGNREFMDAYNELLEEKTFLHINNKDIVARIPPRILGFNHLGGSPRLFDEEHGITLIPKSRSFFDEEEQEMEFEELDEAAQKAILQEMEEARQCVEASTQFMEAPPTLTDDAKSRGFFDNIRPVDDHSMDEYLYKFGGAIVDEEWGRIEEA